MIENVSTTIIKVDDVCVWQRAVFCSVNNLSDIHCAKKKFDAKTNELLLHNEHLTSKSHHLQDRLDQLEKKNLRLIRRLTEQVEISLSLSLSLSWNRTGGDERSLSLGSSFAVRWSTMDLIEESISASRRNSASQRETLSRLRRSHDVIHSRSFTANVHRRAETRNRSIQETIRVINEAKTIGETFLSPSALLRRRHLRQSAEVLLGELNHHSTDKKVRDFLTSLLQAQPPR